MQVHRDDAVDAGRFDRVGAHPGPDRDPRLVLLVALGVAEVRDDRGDRRGAGALERVDPEQQLHEVVVDRERGALHEEDVAAADVLEHADEEVPFGEADASRSPPSGWSRYDGDRATEPATRGPGEQQEVVHGASVTPRRVRYLPGTI